MFSQYLKSQGILEFVGRQLVMIFSEPPACRGKQRAYLCFTFPLLLSDVRFYSDRDFVVADYEFNYRNGETRLVT